MKLLASSLVAYAVVIINILVFFITFNSLLGLPLIIAGLLVYFYHRHLMGSVWTSSVRVSSKLVTAGLFKYVRHPLYLGLLIAGAGGVLSCDWLFLALFLFIDLPYVYSRALYEESILAKNLEGYKAYMKRTKRFL